MYKELEQASEYIAEDNLPEIPAYLKLCQVLVDFPNQDSVNVRCFYTIDGKVFLGILFGETKDSFLVGAPARLIMNVQKQVRAEPLSTESVIRWMKSSTLYMSNAQLHSRYYYYTFLRDGGTIDLPEYLNDKRLSEIDKFIEINKDEVERRPVGSVDSSAGKAEKEIPGSSDKSFRPLVVSEKIH